MSVVLGKNHHGKGRVRLVKVRRTKEKHYIQQVIAEILLEGSTEAAFYSSCNAEVLPTDTVKNTVYCLAKLHDFASIEDFAIILGNHFVTTHPKIIHKASVTLTEEKWNRLSAPDSQGIVRDHHHAFVKGATEQRYTCVVTTHEKVNVISGFKKLTLLKTTQSGFKGFYHDKYTSLPEVNDRLVGTCMNAEWTYNPLNHSKVNYEALVSKVRETLINTFAGPSDKGTFSPSVQYTLYQMGDKTLQSIPELKEITLYMPNVHNLPVDLQQYGIKQDHSHGEIFLPIDEPHGIIQATIQRQSSRL